MTGRKDLIEALLTRAGWAEATRIPLDAHASQRAYVRLLDSSTGASAMLMDADPDKGENAQAFVALADHFRSIGLSAPEIFATETAAGLLVTEDFGQHLFADVIARKPDLEADLYRAATDVLVHLYSAAKPDVPILGPHDLSDLLTVVFADYADILRGGPDRNGQASFMESFTDVMDKVLTDPPVLAHRDFHTENLILLPERRGLCRVGLLDFQDAVLAHPAFDLVLLLQDARHRPPESVESVMLKRYIEATGQDDLAFRASYAVLTVQRNLRVLGLFARLSRSAGKERFAGLMPTLWENLERGLDHPALRPVAGLVRDLIPEPTADVIQFLRNS